MSYSSRSSFRASSSSYKYSSDGGADGYSASSYKTSSRIGGLGSPSRLSETSASRISRLDDDGGITSTTSSSRRLLGRGDDSYESNITSSRLTGSQLYGRKDSDDDFISRRLSSTSSTSGHRAITSGGGEDGPMSSYASRRISRGLSGDLDIGGGESTSYTASRRSVRASGLSSIDDEMTGGSMTKRSRDFSEESSSSSNRKYTRTYGIEDESEPISISRSSRLSSRFSEEDSSMISGSTARRQYSRLSSTGDDDLGTSSATRQYSRLSSLKDDDIPMLTGSSTRRQYSSRLSSMDEGDQSIGGSTKRFSRLSSTNDDEQQQSFSGSTSRRQYSRLSSTDENEPILTGSSVRRQYSSRLTDDDQVLLSSSSSSRRQFSRLGSAADDEPISSASTRQYSRLSSINDDDQILSGSSTRRKYSSRFGSVNDEDDQVLSSSSSARRQYSRLSSAEDEQTYSASSARRQASRLGSSVTNDEDLYSTTGRRPLSRLSSHANEENIESSSKSYKRLDSQESSLSTIRRKSSLVSDEDSLLSGSGRKRSLDKGDSVRSSSYRITSVDRDEDYSVPRSPKIRAKNSELDDGESQSDLLSYSKQRRDSTGETHSLRDTSDASQPRESWKDQVEKAKQLSRELEELASQDLGLPKPKKVMESEKEPRPSARIKVMRQETAEGIESIPVSPQVQEPPTSGEITPRDHPLQSSQISELTSEAVTRAGGLDDFRAYEEQDTVVTESLRSGSVTSIEVNEVAGKPPFVRTASSKPVSRNDHSEHVDLLRPDSRPCTPGGSIVPHAPVFKVKLRDVQLLEASNVRFEMIARAMPLPTVTFYKDDKPLEQSDRVRVVFENKECFELIIDHVKPEDEGIYKAVATNPLGEDMTVGRLTTTKHKDVFRGLDDDFSFAECESTEISRADSRLGSAASASPAFRWFKDGHEFEASDRFQCSFDDQEDSIALLFQHVTPGDAGLYTCVANTCSGKISCSAELNVQGEVRKIREQEAPRIKASMNDVEVNEGASAMLEAKITGFPRPRIVWYKDGEKVVTDERHKFMYEDEESYTLVIKNVKISDAARYRIVASSDLGEVETSGNLTVTTAPKIKRQLRDQCVMTDGPLRLDVGVEGNPPPEAQWFKDGKEVREDDRIKIVAEDDVRSLIIESAKLEDSGNYSCVVSNSCGQQTTQTVVKVNASPKFVTKLKDKSVATGDTVEFKAKVTGEPMPEVEFLKDGKKITSDTRIKIEKEGDTHRLIIRKAKEEDAGSYKCVAKNEHGSVESDAKLEVLTGPIFEESLQDKECNEDDKDIDMSVKVKAKPEPEIKWLYENTEIRMSETKNIIKESDGRYTLRMKSVTQEESGKYTVVASNSEGEARSSGVLTITKSKEKLRKEEMLKKQMSEERKRKEEEKRREEEMKKDEIMEQDDEKRSSSRRASQMEQVKEEDEAEIEQFKASSRRESREKLSRQASKIDEAEIDEKKQGSRRVSKDSGRDGDVTKKIDGDTNTDDMRRDDKDTSPKIDGDVSMDRRKSKDSRDKRLLGDGDVDAGDGSDDQERKFKRKPSGDSTTDSKLSKSGSSRDKVVGDGNIDGSSSSDTKSKPKLRGDSSFDRHPKMPSQDSEKMDESDKIFGDRPKSASERRPSETSGQERRVSSSRPGLEDYPSERKPLIYENDEKEPLDTDLRRKSIESRPADDIVDDHGLLLGRRRSSSKPVDKSSPAQKSDDHEKNRKLSTGTGPETRYGKSGSRDNLSSDQSEQPVEDVNLSGRRGSSTKPSNEAQSDQKSDDLMRKSPSGSKLLHPERKPSLPGATDDRKAPSRSDSGDDQSRPRDDEYDLEEQPKPFSKISRKPSISKVPEVDSQTDAERRPSLQRTPTGNVPDDGVRRKSSSSHPDIGDRKPSIGTSDTDTGSRPSFRRSPSDNISDEKGRRKGSSAYPNDNISDRKPSIGISEPDNERRSSMQKTPSDNAIGDGVRRKSSSSHPDHDIDGRKPSIAASDTDTGDSTSFRRSPSDNIPDEKGRRKSSSAYSNDNISDRKPSIGSSEPDNERRPSLQRMPSGNVPDDAARRKSSSSHPDHAISDRKPSIGTSETEGRPTFQRSPSDSVPGEGGRRKSSSAHPDLDSTDRKPSIGTLKTDSERKLSLKGSPSDNVLDEIGKRKSSLSRPNDNLGDRKPSIAASETDSELKPSLQSVPSDNILDDRGRRKSSSSHPDHPTSDRKPSIGISDTERRPSFQRSPSDNIPDKGGRRKSSSAFPDHINTDRKPSIGISEPDDERRSSMQKTPSDNVVDDGVRRKSSSSHPDHDIDDRKPSIAASNTDTGDSPSFRRSPSDNIPDEGGRRKSSSAYPNDNISDRKPSIGISEPDDERRSSMQKTPSDNVVGDGVRRKSSSSHPDHDIDDRKPSIAASNTDTGDSPSFRRSPSDNIPDEGGRRKSSSAYPNDNISDRKPSIGISEPDDERRSSMQRTPSDNVVGDGVRRKISSSHSDHPTSDRKPSIGTSENEGRSSFRRSPSDNIPDGDGRRKSSLSHPNDSISDRKPSIGSSEPDDERRPSLQRTPSGNVSDERGRRKSSSFQPNDSMADRKPSIGTSEIDEKQKLGKSPSDHRKPSLLDASDQQTPDNAIQKSTSPDKGQAAPVDERDIYGKQPDKPDEGKSSRKPSLLGQDSLKSPSSSRRGSGLGKSDSLSSLDGKEQSKPIDNSSPELRRSSSNASDQGLTEDAVKNDKPRRKSSFKPILEDVTDTHEPRKPEYMRGQSSTIDNRGSDVSGPTISHPDDDERNAPLFGPRRSKDGGLQIEELDDDQPNDQRDTDGPRGKVTEPEEVDSLPSRTLPDSSKNDRDVFKNGEKLSQDRKDSLAKQHGPRKDSLKIEGSSIPRDQSESNLEPGRRPALRKELSTDIPSDGDMTRRKGHSSPTDSLRHVKPGSIPTDSRNDLIKPNPLDDETSPKSSGTADRDRDRSDDKPKSKDDLLGRRSSAVSDIDRKTPEQSKSIQPGHARKPSLYDDKSQEIPNEDDSTGRRKSSTSSHGPGDSIRDSPKSNDKGSRKLSFAPEPEVYDGRTKRKPSILDSSSDDQDRKLPEKSDSIDSRRGSQSKLRPEDDDVDMYGRKPSGKRPSFSKDNRLVDSRSPSASDLVSEEIPKDNLGGRRKRIEPEDEEDKHLKPRSSISDDKDSKKPSKSDDQTERRRPSSDRGLNGKISDEIGKERKRSVDGSDGKPTITDQKTNNIPSTTRKPSLTPISEVDHPEDKRRSSLKNGADRKGPDSRRRDSALEPTLEAASPKSDSKASPTGSDHPDHPSRKSSKPQIDDSQPNRRGSSPLVADDGKLRRDKRRESDSKPEKYSLPEHQQPEEESPIPSKINELPPTNRRRSQIGDKDQKPTDEDSSLSRKSTKPGERNTGIASKYPVDGRKDDTNEKPSKFDDDILSDQQTDQTSESHDEDIEEVCPPLKDRAPRPRGDSIFDAEERAKITGAEPVDDDGGRPDSKGRKLIADSDMGDKPVFEKGLVDREAMETDNNVEFDVKLKDTKPKPKIDWFVDDVLIMPNDRRYKMVPDEAECTYKLIIRRPDETMEGVYKCKASNEYGYDETSAKFTIIREPKFIKKLRDKDIDIHDKLILSVKVDGIPEPEVTWFKDGEEVAASATITLKRESDGSHSLIIEKSQNKDEGTYKCVAINKVGKDETEAKITVLSPPEFSKKLEDQSVTLGESIVLEVKVSGADRVMWYKDGLKYCDAIAESDGTTYRLKLGSAKMDDAGEYRCVAWNSFGRVDSGIGKLTVKSLEDREPPKFTKPLQDVEVAGDTDARFDVQVTGSPKPKVSWLRDGMDLRESDRIIMKEEGEDNSYSLTIKNTKQSDEAVYSCSASNEMGEAQDQASLTVKMAEKQEKPRITGLRDIETEIGTSVDFSAKVSGYPVPETVWKKDGKPLKSDDNIRISRDTEDETLHHLTVRKVQKSDTGTFTLQATNPAGQEEKSAELTITIEQPHFTKQLRNITGKPSTDIILEAEVAGYPSPNITWYKDGKELKDSSAITISQRDGVCRLILKNISDNSAGIYTCKAENEAGTDETQATVTVSVGQESPRFTKPLHDETVDQGEEIVLEVEVKGSPPPLISWFKDGRRLSQSPKVSITQTDGISKLTLKNANDDNAGLYTCKADNDTGQDETQANVSVNPPQEAPKFIRPLRDIAGQPGKNITLETEVTGFPSPKITWYQNGRKLSESSNISISESDGICKLVLRNISESSIGTFSCKAENPLGQDETRSNVSVQSPIKFIKSLPPKMDVPEGDSFRLEAQLSGPLDQAEIKWLKDGKEIPEDRRHRISVDQDGKIVLIVEDSSPNDVGNYQVVVQTPTQKIHSDCHVSLIPKEIKKVPRDPKFLEELRPAKVEEGKPLKLEAKVSGFPKPNVSWYKDDEPLSPGPHHGFIYEPDGTVGLLLDHCTSDDAGVYKAVATNDSGDATTEAHVDVEKPKPPSSKPSFSCDMKPIDVKQGEPIFLQVKVDGNPPPTIKWLKDGDEIKPDGSHINIVTEPDGTTTLRIDHSVPGDSGKYTISAANDAGRNRTSVPVFVRRETKPVKKPEFDMPLVATTLKADEPGEISVKIVGEPKPEVKWFKNGEELVPDGRIRFEEKPSGTHSIVINNVLPGDAGNYTCVIGNPGGEERSSAPVLVNQPPDFSKKLERSLSAIEGFPVKIETKVEGEPKPEVTWSKDGETIIPDGDRIRIINEPDGLSSVVIQAARPSDKGTYGCTATNPLGTKKTEGDIDVKPKSKESDEESVPRFIQSISDNDVDEGKSMRFEGIIEGNPISDIKWFRNGEELTYGSNIIPSFDGRRACLEIRNSGPRDEGEYECRVSNQLGTVSSKANGYVRPRCPPKFTDPLSDVSWSSRNPVTLSCRISGNPEPEIQWYYNGKLIQPSLKYRMKKDGDNLSLTVLDPRPTDGGSFECRAKNSLGMDSTKCNLRISDRVSKDEPAHFIKRFNDYECEEGRTAKFTACISGNPKPDLKWFRDGREFKPSSKHTIDVESNGIVRLTIKNVEPIDIGEYRLEISNSVGRDSSIARLALEEPRFKRREPLDAISTKGPPGIPSGVVEKPKILRMWDTGVSLGWKPSVSHVPTQPVTYAVDWTRYPSEDWKTYRSGIRGTRCDIPGLKPGQDYSFRVSAMNKYGTSKPSPTLTAYRSKLYEPGDFKPKEYDIERPPTDKQACAPYWLRKEEDVMYGILRQPVTIEFWVYGYPEPNVIWYFNDVEIKVGGGSKFDTLHDRNGKVCLFINRMTEQDVGVYTCKAWNEHGETVKKIRLLEAEPPMFTLRLKETTGMAYKSVRMECKVTGNPMPQVKWFKGWSPLYDSDRIKILWEDPDHSTMFMNSAITRDSGLYSVTATNFVGSASCSANLSIENDEILYNWANYVPRVVKPKRRAIEEHYDIGDEIGRGTQGVIYHAQERRSGESYATKFMHGKGPMREFMQQELDAMNQLFHPKLLRLADAFDHKDNMCLVTDLCDGGDLLKSILERGTLTEGEVANYIKQVLEGLNHMHCRDIGHLGLTIGDILVEHVNSNDIKIGDFGLTRKLAPGHPLFLRYGHPEFVAPETVNSKEATLAADMWSVGIITYLLLTGISPFLGENDRETLTKLKEGQINFSHDAFAGVSGNARDFLTKLLVTEPTKRLDVKRALHHPWLQHGSISSLTEQLPCINNLKDYREKWKAWHKNASCKKWYRRNPMETCFTDPSKMIYPPDQEYSPPDTPTGDHRSKFKASEFDPSVSARPGWETMDMRSESQYQSGPDTYLLPHRDVDFPLRIREYLRVGASRSPSLANNLRMSHWGDPNPYVGRRSSPQVSVRERRRFVEVMDEEIDDERKGLDNRRVPMRLQHEIGTPGYAYGQVHHLKQEASLNIGEKITVKAVPPYFREKIRDVIINESDEVIFTCYPVGDPKPTITWFRNDGIILESPRAQYKDLPSGRVQLHIQPSYAMDAGCYKCVARNDHGVAFCRARLKFGTKPERPDTPKVKDVSSHEICLCWPPPKNSGNSWITSYSLEYQKRDESTWKTVSDDITQEIYLVDSLDPETTYVFRLKAKNKFGWSEVSLETDPITTKSAQVHSRVTLPRTLSIVRASERKKPPEDIEQQTDVDTVLEREPIVMKNEDPHQMFTIGDEISRGRFSLILSASMKDTNERIALKVCLSDNQSSSGIMNEHDIMKSLCHEKIARLVAACNGSNLIALAMEPLSGIDVVTFLSRKYQYNEDTVTKIITQILDGIEYLNFRNICVLELQPDNVVLVDDRLPHIKLVDFANARHVPVTGTRVSIQGQTEYLAPEILKKDEVFAATDIWCVGVLTYILLSGVSPFRGETEEETVENVTYVRYHFDHLYKEVTQEAIRFLMLVFKRSPSKRPTIDECLDHKWLIPNDYAVRKREKTLFSSSKLSQFTEANRSLKHSSTPGKLLTMFGIS
ncbi:uncharacterized protein LOC141854581 isoform X3 [Brevipalpus obovatus]|uniref:uncharacterized protein LOC141854581 isoform X3 n=1 Tax=Brevipalpus obovatus TaxID=246614 RepID=UPI003D9F6722